MIQTMHDNDLIDALERLFDTERANVFRDCLNDTPEDADDDEILETVNDALEFIEAPFEVMEIVGKDNGFYIWKVLVVDREYS